jgi:hypothetical protein
MPSDRTAVFLDTTIQIARFVRGKRLKDRIEAFLCTFQLRVTSLVVRQEFKRRLLNEAVYLLLQLRKRGSFEELRRHVQNVLPPQQQRKTKICLDVLATIDEHDSGDDRTARAELFLEELVETGLAEFDELVDHVVEQSNCACARSDIRRKKGGTNYDIGTQKCSQVKDKCGLSAFLADKASTLRSIMRQLSDTPEGDKSEEIKTAEAFGATALATPNAALNHDPCLTVGDLLIALESEGIPTFYTMNYKESQHYCAALGQALAIRKNDPDADDEVLGR